MISRLLDWLAGDTVVTRFSLGCLLAAAIGIMVLAIAENGAIYVVVVAVAVLVGFLIASGLARR